MSMRVVDCNAFDLPRLPAYSQVTELKKKREILQDWEC
jgi:hypothetical protein